MYGNKYQTSASRKMLDNITYMLENTTTVEPEPILEYYTEDVRAVNRYRNTILPRLRTLIEKANESQKTMPSENQGDSITNLKEKIDLYECVIAQLSPDHSPQVKQKMLSHYYSNQYKITNQTMKLCLDNVLSANSRLKDYQESKLGISHIWQQFKNFINLDEKLSLATNIQQIKFYLMRTKAESVNKLVPFDEITSVSLILNQCIQRLKQGALIGDYRHILNNIKIQDISQPLACLVELVEKLSQKNQVKVEEKEQFHPCMDERQYYQALQYLEILPGIAETIEKIIEPGSSFDYTRLNPDYLTKIVGRLSAKINKALQMEAKAQSHLSEITYENETANKQLIHSLKTISQLRAQGDKLKIELEKSQKLVQLQREFTLSLNEALSNKTALIEKLEKDIHILEKEAALPKQNHQDSRQLQELRQRFQLLSKERNELHTQTHNLFHQLEDERTAHQENLKQQIQKITKIIHSQKAKEIQRLEERRRIEKSKLSKEAQELFDELQQLKDKYYTEIGNKLLRSRVDQSFCKSDKGVGNSFAVENNVLEGLDDEENEDNHSRSVNELENQFKKQFQEEILRLNMKNTELQAQIQSKQSQIKELGLELQKYSHQKQQVLKQLQVKTQHLLRINDQATISKNKIRELIAANKMYQTALKRSSGIKQQSSTSCRPLFISYEKTLLQGQIFDQNQDEKSILLKHISAYTHLELIKTKLLYQYYPNNKTNFHSFIDNKRGLLCVVKASNTIIAGFYPGSLTDGETMNEGGLLVSVRNNRSYALMEKKNDNSKINYRGMTYDPYYVVFGNAEMRIRTGQNRVFSNFGIQNGYFNYANSSRNVNEFLGEGENREIEFQLCQFYQLFFQGQAITPSKHSNLQ